MLFRSLLLWRGGRDRLAVKVLELRPAKAVSCVETDLQVDFAPPVGYVEPVRAPAAPAAPKKQPGPEYAGLGMGQAIGYDAMTEKATTAVGSFVGSGKKLKGPVRPGVPDQPDQPMKRFRKGLQPLSLPPGTLFFGYDIVPVKKNQAEEKKPGRFSARGKKLGKT